jgi:hypothetical protein
MDHLIHVSLKKHDFVELKLIKIIINKKDLLKMRGDMTCQNMIFFMAYTKRCKGISYVLEMIKLGRLG